VYPGSIHASSESYVVIGTGTAELICLENLIVAYMASKLSASFYEFTTAF
jgi:hypothetical protein